MFATECLLTGTHLLSFSVLQHDPFPVGLLTSFPRGIFCFEASPFWGLGRRMRHDEQFDALRPTMFARYLEVRWLFQVLPAN